MSESTDTKKYIKRQSTIEYIKERFSNIDKIKVEDSSKASNMMELRLNSNNTYQDI